MGKTSETLPIEMCQKNVFVELTLLAALLVATQKIYALDLFLS